MLWLVALILTEASAAESWTVDTQAEWEQATATSRDVELKDGIASPTAETASIQSTLKRFREKRSAESITFAQSPIWENWERTKNIGTDSMDNAPVLLSLGQNNYWMFAKYLDPLNPTATPTKKIKEAKKAKKNKRVETAKREKEIVKQAEPASAFEAKTATLEGFDIPLLTTPLPNQFNAPGGLKKGLGGYHAWQSRDMLNWVHHGPITEEFAKWVTTAEYADGKVYIYYDFPNDQDPHVYVDEDLTDGVPGQNMGITFKDPSHGSDCAFIRDLEGAFHVIAEDWSPINARTHSWDSPLATHVVSADGIKDFKILAPPVDERTKPTGKMGSFSHPHWQREDPKNYTTNQAEYEIHEPEQNAFGDWAAISIGGQYYLFGDFDPAGSHGKEAMSVAWFTSSSLDKQFTFCGNIGKGHPDPDICFAEGRFYLATQQDSDFTSPGPWVETVEVRVGVDVDDDAKIDQWTDWQAVKEAYDYTPGFAKQIQRTSASMDLSSLPQGFGFRFEVKMTDTTPNKSKPLLDKIELSFGKGGTE
ncbi:hypothetical protein [Rubripirellula tenax]|nr:hypothetical protein [Rubripirellula tenax]